MKLLHLGIWNSREEKRIISGYLFSLFIKSSSEYILCNSFFQFFEHQPKNTHFWICHSFLDSARRAPWEPPPQIKNNVYSYYCSKDSRKIPAEITSFAILFFISLNIHQKLVYFYCVHRGKKNNIQPFILFKGLSILYIC